VNDYGRKLYDLDREFLASVTTLDPARTVRALVFIWVQIAAIVLAVRFLVPAGWFWYLYLPLAFLMAGRFGALLQVVHEAAHGLLHPTKRINDLISAWFAARPIGVSHEGYSQGHYRHHAFTGTARDTEADSEKYRVPNARDPRLYALLAKDLLGITALRVFFAYGQNAVDLDERRGQRARTGSVVGTLAGLGAVQLVVLGGLFGFDVVTYALLWLYPAMGPHMFLMRIRGIAEHGLPGQLGVAGPRGLESAAEGTYYTRSFGTPARTYRWRPIAWIERLLIGSLHVNYHHEHHLCPNVPFYHLARVHERIARPVQERNRDVYVRGYFSAALKNVLQAP
jgi:fatty acid desaturase